MARTTGRWQGLTAGTQAWPTLPASPPRHTEGERGIPPCSGRGPCFGLVAVRDATHRFAGRDVVGRRWLTSHDGACCWPMSAWPSKAPPSAALRHRSATSRTVHSVRRSSASLARLHGKYARRHQTLRKDSAAILDSSRASGKVLRGYPDCPRHNARSSVLCANVANVHYHCTFIQYYSFCSVIEEKQHDASAHSQPRLHCCPIRFSIRARCVAPESLRDLEYMRGTCAASRQRVCSSAHGVGPVCQADRHPAEIVSPGRGAWMGRATFITVGNPARRRLAELANTGHRPTTMSNAPTW